MMTAKTSAACLLALGVTGLACTVGDGTGEAKGALYVKGCYGPDPADNYGTPAQPRAYDLQPDFFAGEPLEDPKRGGSDNRIVVRLQKEGKRREDNDVLVFDIDAWRVAQCLRGVPEILALPELKRFCSWVPGRAWPRLRVGPTFPVRANLSLRKQCPGNRWLIATARDSLPFDPTVDPTLPEDQWLSYIELRDFGEATMNGDFMKVDVEPTFKIEFGQHLHAERFHLDLIDDQVLAAQRDRKLVPTPHMVGHLDGFFNFSLQRGQGAQTFP